MPIVAAGLDVWVVAFLFLLVALAGALVLRAVTSKAAHGVPGIGGVLGPAIDSFWSSLFVAITPATNAALGAFTNTLDALTAQWTQLTQTLVGFGQLSLTAVHKITTYVVPRAITLAVVRVEALVLNARAYSLALVRASEVQLNRALQASQALSVTLFHQAQAFTLGRVLQAEAQAGHLFALAESDALQLAAQERAFTVGAITGAEAYAQHLLNSALVEMHAIEAGLLGQIGGVSTRDQAALRDEVNALQKQIADARAALTAAGAASIAVVAADVAAIRALRCLQFCDALAGLGEVLTLVELGALFYMVEQAVNNPGALTQTWLRDVQPAIDETAQFTRRALGV